MGEAERIAQAEADGRVFYVSVVNGRRHGLLVGPFPTEAAARAQVGPTRTWVLDRDPWAWFYGFGTASLPAEEARPGRLNVHLLPETHEEADHG